MSSQAGWYPDPGGQQGLFRFWDGQSWSAATTNNPQAPPPSQGLVPNRSGPNPYQSNPYQPGQPPGAGYATPPTKSPMGWWIGAGALLVVMVVLAAFFVRGAVNRINTPSGPTSGGPSAQLCPTDSSQATAVPKQYNDGRVHGGALSYPLIPAWNAPEGDNRVPFGRDVMSQNIMVHSNYDDAGQSWVASVLVGELVSGDGFFTPEQGSEIVVKCVTGTFYGTGTKVTREDKVNRATTVDGTEAWIVESQLSFDIENLPTKGELLIVVIVASGEATSSLYYASIPDDSPQYVQPARDALKNLKVEK